MKLAESKAEVSVQQSTELVLLKVGGVWCLTEPFANPAEIMPAGITNLEIKVVPENLVEWDTSLPIFLLRVRAWCRDHAARMNIEELPDTLKRLFQLVSASDEEASAVKAPEPKLHTLAPALHRLLSGWKSSTQFIGECAISVMELPTDPRHFHWKALVTEMMETGPKALPIIAVLSFLVGMTFTYESSIKLEHLGLLLYVIQSIGAAVLQQIGPLIAAVVLAGRTGAAFAAHIANMKLGGELDALKMVGGSPIRFLVLPRIAALVLMMPLTVLYSDFAGILGGMTMAVGRMGIPMVEFWVKLLQAISLTDFEVSLVKSFVFAIVIGLAGTLRGLHSEHSSIGVGRAVTSAVVTGTVGVLAANTLFSPILHRLGF